MAAKAYLNTWQLHYQRLMTITTITTLSMKIITPVTIHLDNIREFKLKLCMMEKKTMIKLL